MKDLEKKKPVLFCGDLNVAHTPDDLANPKSNERTHGFTAEERSGVDAIVKHGFVDTFRMFTSGNGHYSWWSNFANSRARNIGWRIDYWFVSKSLEKKVKSSKIVMDQAGSDHAPVVLEIDL
jgi:exodeoxyribonuclease-3